MYRSFLRRILVLAHPVCLCAGLIAGALPGHPVVLPHAPTLGATPSGLNPLLGGGAGSDDGGSGGSGGANLRHF